MRPESKVPSWAPRREAPLFTLNDAYSDAYADGWEIPTPIRDALVAQAGELGLVVGSDLIVYRATPGRLLRYLERAGATWHPVGRWHEWPIAAPSPLTREAVAAPPNPQTLGGIIRIDWQCGAYLAARFSARRGLAERVALLGPSREDALALLHALWAAELAARGRRARGWGASNGLIRILPVDEKDLVLPPELQTDLLGYVDRFWRRLPEAMEYGLAARRGLLFFGPPGCGKTLMVRHLMTRYPEAALHVYVPGGELPAFQAMLAAIDRAAEPALLILEDIDLAIGQSLYRGHLLNVLDGLLALRTPTLLIATSNDPRPLDRHLLDRPGRFDRVFPFKPPGPTEREALFIRYARIDLAPDDARCLAALADGLTGAHVREACQSAALRALDGADHFTALGEEIAGMKDQHRLARELQQGLAAHDGAIGFRPGRPGDRERRLD